jgi:UDP-glucose 4-epimerase
MRALVTGCAGFIGSHLTERLLSQGYQVSGIDCFTDYYAREIKEANISNALKDKNFNFIEDDILKMDKFPQAGYVFHEAAQAGVRDSWGKNFAIYVRNNIEATQRLLEFYRGKELKKFVYASSSSVYGDAELPMKENSGLKPISPYGVSKLAGEHLCYLYWKNYDVPTISLRYFTVYGPRQRPDMAIHKFVSTILKGEEVIVFGDGSQTRSFTFVDDVVEATILAAKSESTGEVFNIAGEGQISINGLIKEIEKVAAKEARIKYVEKQKGDVRDTMADVSKATYGLGWRPKVEISQGLSRFTKWLEAI